MAFEYSYDTVNGVKGSIDEVVSVLTNDVLSKVGDDTIIHCDTISISENFKTKVDELLKVLKNNEENSFYKDLTDNAGKMKEIDSMVTGSGGTE